MIFKLVDAGGMRGMPALHFYLNEGRDIKEEIKNLPEAIKTFGLTPGKRFAVLDTTLAGKTVGADEALEFVRVLRDWGFHVSGHVRGDSLPAFAREVHNLVTFINPAMTWLQFSTNNIVLTHVPDQDVQIAEQNARSPRFIRVPPLASMNNLAKFLFASQYTWAVQIGPTGGMEVEL